MKSINGNIIFEKRPRIISAAAVVGKKEGEGPLRDCFDRIIHDSYVGKDTFEQAESELTHTAVRIALNKADCSAEDIDVAFCGDLLNQCVASSFAMRPFGIPYAGVYGACSTMALGLGLSAISVESGAAERALCAASSHYCTAERQYRFPLEYGSQRPPTAQWTVTGAGACVVARGRASANQASKTQGFTHTDTNEDHPEPYGDDPYIGAFRIGRIVDYNITDQNNMGAAMAPADVKIGTKDTFGKSVRTLSVDAKMIVV